MHPWVQRFALLLILLWPAAAAAEVALSVAPIRIEHHIRAGKSMTDIISITNAGDESTRVKVSVVDWDLDRVGTPRFYDPGSTPQSASPWIHINPSDFRLLPGETTDIRYTLTIPADAEDQGYRTAVLMETVPTVTPGQPRKQVHLIGRVATVIYQTVGSPVVKGSVEDIQYTPTPDGLKITLTYKNSGMVHYRLKGALVVTTPQGKRLTKIELPDAPVLPGSVRDAVTYWTKGVPHNQEVIVTGNILMGERLIPVTPTRVQLP